MIRDAKPAGMPLSSGLQEDESGFALQGQRHKNGPMPSTSRSRTSAATAVGVLAPRQRALRRLPAEGVRERVEVAVPVDPHVVALSVALPNKKAATVALAIHEHVVLNGPTTCPQKLISDNGSDFAKALAAVSCPGSAAAPSRPPRDLPERDCV